MNTSFARELAVAKTIARQAGEIMRQYFDGDQQTQQKADGTPVTIADKQINRLVIEELTKHFDDTIIGEEESTGGYGMGRLWFCDPIDGTKGFTWGTPTAMFSLALVVDGRPVMGVAYDPFLDRLYEGVKGQGSACNGLPLTVSLAPTLENQLVAITSSANKIIKHQDFIGELTNRGASLACFSGAVCKSVLVARGRLAGYLETVVNAYDMAAVHVIVEEAGGRVTSLTGEAIDYSKPFKGAIVSNGLVHQELLNCALHLKESS